MPRRLAWTVAFVLLLALGLSACDSSDESSSSGDALTLASFMGWEDDDDGASEARWREQEAEVEELVRACMAEKGFEYIPVDHSQGSTVVYDEQDEEERVRTQGFGITTWYGDDAVEDDLAVDDEWHDPNWELVEAMSESEQQAYYEALYGSEEEQRANATVEYDEETGEEIGWMTEGWGPGCRGEAEEAVHGGRADQSLWEELNPAFEELYARVEADPRIIEWNEQWSRCMAEAGHDYASPNDMYESIYDDFQRRLDDILGPDGGYSDPFEGMTEAEVEAFFEERTEDEIDAFFREADQQRNDDIDQAALSALQQEEIEFAITEYECRGGDEFWEIYQEVSAEYEADFIAENRETLERIRDAESS